MSENKLLLFILIIFTAIGNAQNFDRPALFDGCNDPLISDAQQIECSQKKLLEFIAKRTEYPDSAVVKEKEGLVLLRFTIDEKGLVTMVELLKGIDKSCNEAALSIIRSFPPFSPALKNNIPISSELILPIRFAVKNLFHHKQEDLYRLHWAKVEKDTVSRKEINRMLTEMPFVRDAKGINYRIEHMELTYIKGQKLETVKMEDKDFWSVEMSTLFQKARRGGIYVLSVQIKDRFQKIEVVREFYIN